jgi:NADH-quinone oxidoreductase subunit N
MTAALLLAPKVALGVAVLLALLLDSFHSRGTRRGLMLASAILLFGGAVAAAVAIGRTDEFLAGALVADRYSIFADIVLMSLGGVIVLAALDGVGSGDDAGDFFTLLFLSILGSSLLASAGNLITVFLAIELAIIPTFALVAFRAEERSSFEAALKYFLLSVFASAILLFGLSLVFGSVGTVDLPLPSVPESSGLLLVGLGLTLAGFGFKLAASPFHQWVPDSFEVAHAEVAAFIAVGPKLAAVVALVRILEGLSAQSGAWTAAIAGMAALSMVWGNLGALRQTRIPRMLAYSAVAHAGYALVGLAGGGPRGVEGAVVYFAAYSAAAVGAFVVVGILRREGDGDSLQDLAGLGRRRPWEAAAMTIFMISLIGIPLFAGFWGKFSVFLGAVEGGVYWLAVLGVLNSVASFGYYGNVVRLMYLVKPESAGVAEVRSVLPEEGIPSVEPGGPVAALRAGGWSIRVALGLAAGLTLLLGVVPALLFGALGATAGL